jgi:hypothetical protein
MAIRHLLGPHLDLLPAQVSLNVVHIFADREKVFFIAVPV